MRWRTSPYTWHQPTAVHWVTTMSESCWVIVVGNIHPSSSKPRTIESNQSEARGRSRRLRGQKRRWTEVHFEKGCERRDSRSEAWQRPLRVLPFVTTRPTVREAHRRATHETELHGMLTTTWNKAAAVGGRPGSGISSEYQRQPREETYKWDLDGLQIIDRSGFRG